MTDFYGVYPDELPPALSVGVQYVAVEAVPAASRVKIAAFLKRLRALHAEDPFAFKSAVRVIAPRLDAPLAENTITDDD